ncbi:helix-turn-helix domain-containing protein [Candidatus Bathyarchaeota archaeon]|nr:helix-turn-helix domain-containing protein [Candidatus Bathyarchaeota archaeon]
MSLRELHSIINSPELGADELMKCALGIKIIEIEAYCVLYNAGSSTVQDVASKLNRSRPTTQRLLQSLVEKGLAIREEELIGLGGYKYVYKAVSPEILKNRTKEILDKWYQRMLSEVDFLPSKIELMGCNKKFNKL